MYQVVMRISAKPSEYTLFNSAAACLEKAASLRAAADDAVSKDIARRYLEIASKWEQLAADFDSSSTTH